VRALGLKLLEGKLLEIMREGSAVLAASECSGIVMGLAKRGTERNGRGYLKGWAQITWGPIESITGSGGGGVMHRHE
jgi:hypothetical protein